MRHFIFWLDQKKDNKTLELVDDAAYLSRLFAYAGTCVTSYDQERKTDAVLANA